MHDKQIAKFDYKLLYNVLTNTLCVSKWNPNVKMSCEMCGGIENVKPCYTIVMMTLHSYGKK